MIAFAKLASTLYTGSYILAFVVIFVFNTFYGRKYSIKPLKALIYTLVSYSLVFGWSYILAWIANGFTWGHHNAIRVYIWFPLVLLLVGKLFNIKWQVSCEYMAPSTCIVYGIARIGCIFTGCCYGYPAEWGIYSVLAGTKCIPVQLFESITALTIAGIIIYLAKKKKYVTEKGNLYPLMLVMYGGSRFLWEFFADNVKLLGSISELAIWAFGTFVVGIVWIVVIHCQKTKVSIE